MFKKLVGIEPLALIPSANTTLESFAETVVLHTDMPTTADAIVERIGDADGVLLSYNHHINPRHLRTLPQREIYRHVLFLIHARKCECRY